MNKNDRVEYYPPNDFFCGNNLNKIETMEIPSFESLTINDAIEFLEIEKYFKQGIRSKSWTNEQFAVFSEKSKSLVHLAAKFLNQLSDETIVDEFNNVDINYYKYFWKIFNRFKLYNKISSTVFSQIINGEHTMPSDIFRHKHIVDTYGKVLREQILQDFLHIRMLLHIYEQEYTGDVKLYLPKELTENDISDFFARYIESENPSVYALDTITKMRKTKKFSIDDMIRYKAKQRYEIEFLKLSEKVNHYEEFFEVSFVNNTKEERVIKNDFNKYCLQYSVEWLLFTLDKPSILQNFIYLFEYVDVPQMRCNLVCKPAMAGNIEKVFSTKSSIEYHTYTSFKCLNCFAVLQMREYYDFLKAQSIRFEDVLQWFFTTYLQEEFACPEIRVSFPSEGTTYCEKCSTIITVLDSVIRQYSNFVKYGTNDFRLLEMSTSPMRFDDIPSLVSNKYIYGLKNSIYSKIIYWLFSDQCIYRFHPNKSRITDKCFYSCLLELILREKVYLTDYDESDYFVFQHLEEQHIIKIADDNLITLDNQLKIIILKDLHENEVISRHHYSDEENILIDQMIADGVVEEKSSLLSEQEVSYFNFLLNDAEYCNGLKIRNKYIHGIHQVQNDNEYHKANYMILLIVFVILAIKINDDFCLAEKINKIEGKIKR